ncbi:MAG: phenylalanine--tRNA ligase subunit alpha, partial [Nitrospinales bacterium]
MIETIKERQARFESDVGRAASLDQIDELRVRYLGRKGCIPSMMKALRDVAPDEKPRAGKQINDFKRRVETLIEARKRELKERSPSAAAEETFDASLPGRKEPPGSL